MTKAIRPDDLNVPTNADGLGLIIEILAAGYVHALRQHEHHHQHLVCGHLDGDCFCGLFVEDTALGRQAPSRLLVGEYFWSSRVRDNLGVSFDLFYEALRDKVQEMTARTLWQDAQRCDNCGRWTGGPYFTEGSNSRCFQCGRHGRTESR